MISESALQALRANLRGQLVLPKDADYDDARRIHNAMIDRRPAAIVRCAGVADVVAAVNFARQGGLLVAVAESLGAVLMAPSLKELVSFVLLVVILLFRPQGLFGGKTG